MKYYVESFLSYLYKEVIVSRAGHDTNNVPELCSVQSYPTLQRRSKYKINDIYRTKYFHMNS